jgi:hypothetical protein
MSGVIHKLLILRICAGAPLLEHSPFGCSPNIIALILGTYDRLKTEHRHSGLPANVFAVLIRHNPGIYTRSGISETMLDYRRSQELLEIAGVPWLHFAIQNYHIWTVAYFLWLLLSGIWFEAIEPMTPPENRFV